jgi:hypothetical protein
MNSSANLAADVKMVVLDGIVMGPTVSFEYYYLNYHKHIKCL